jgi:hypothetical protein
MRGDDHGPHDDRHLPLQFTIWAIGAFLFTLMVRVANAITAEDLRVTQTWTGGPGATDYSNPKIGG